jgi:hypothetical protein
MASGGHDAGPRPLGPANPEAIENAPLGPMVVQGSANELSGDPTGVENTPKIPVSLLARHAGVEPATYGSGERRYLKQLRGLIPQRDRCVTAP